VGTFILSAGDIHQTTLQLRQALYTFGRQEYGLAQRRDETQAARETFFDSRDDRVLAVKQGFYGILLQKRLIEVAQQTLRDLEQQYHYATLRLAEGVATEYDVLLTRSQLANARPQLIAACHGLEIAVQNLLALLGDNDDLSFEPLGTFDERPVGTTFESCLAMAIQNRKDLKALQLQRDAVRHSVKAVQATYRPTLSAVATHDRSKGSRFPVDQEVEINSLALSFDVPIYDGGLSHAQARELQAQERKLGDQIQQLKLNIRAQVMRAFLTVSQSQAAIDAARESIRTASMSVRNAHEGFQAGVRSSLEVLTSETELFKARTNLAQAQHDYSVAKSGLERVSQVDLSRLQE
jgi:TolC family type I secretion outer membrane protein